MSIRINSSVPTFAGGVSTYGQIMLSAPNVFSSTMIPISNVIGLQAALDSKLNDILTQTGALHVTATGADLNLLTGTSSYGLTTADLQKVADLTATATEIDYTVGVVAPIQDQLNDRPAFSQFTAANEIIVGTGAGTGAIEPFGTVLNQFGLNDLLVTTADVSMSGHRIINLQDPVNPQDAATRAFVLTAVGAGQFLPIDGSGAMTGALDLNGNSLILDADGNSAIVPGNDTMGITLGGNPKYMFSVNAFNMGGNPINALGAPVLSNDAATKGYVDTSALLLTGGTMLGNIDLDGHGIIISADGLTRIDGSVNGQFNVLIGSNPAFSVASSTVDVGARRVTNVADPIAPQDALTLNAADAKYMPLDGSTPLTGNLDMDGHFILNPGDPTAGNQVGDRDYNDGRYLKIASNLSDIGNAATARNNLQLAVVAASGDYNDLSNLPTIPTDLGSLSDVNVGTPGSAQNGFVLTWNDVSSEYVLAQAPVTSVYGRTGAVVATNGDYTAAQVTNVPAGSISATNVQNAINSLDTSKLSTAGGTMLGNLDMGGNNISNVGTLDVNNHVFTPGSYTSALEGNSFFMRTSNVPTAATPTYSFFDVQNTGMYWSGSDIAFSVNGSNKMAIGSNYIDMNNNRIVRLADPILDTDGVNLQYLNNLRTVRILGTASNIDMTFGLGTFTPIYTVPTGKKHIITEIMLVATSYIPGVNPIDPVVSFGIAGPEYDDIVETQVASWGVGGAADQVIYMDPNQAASSPNPGNTVFIQKDTLAGGTLSSLIVTVYVLGIEFDA